MSPEISEYNLWLARKNVLVIGVHDHPLSAFWLDKAAATNIKMSSKRWQCLCMCVLVWRTWLPKENHRSVCVLAFSYAVTMSFFFFCNIVLLWLKLMSNGVKNFVFGMVNVCVSNSPTIQHCTDKALQIVTVILSAVFGVAQDSIFSTNFKICSTMKTLLGEFTTLNICGSIWVCLRLFAVVRQTSRNYYKDGIISSLPVTLSHRRPEPRTMFCGVEMR